VLTAVGVNVDSRMPGFPGNNCRTYNIRKILKHGVIARAPGEYFNVWPPYVPSEEPLTVGLVMSMRRRCQLSTSKL